MVSGLENSSTQRRRSLDAEINLVPFIDLLSMCICFLLMTAVWTQTGVLEVKQSRGTAAAKPTGPYDLNLRFLSPSSVELTLKKDQKPAKKVVVQGQGLNQLLQNIQTEMKVWPIHDPNPNSESSFVASAFVVPAKDVPYSSLIGVLDVLRSQRITNLGVMPVGDKL